MDEKYRIVCPHCGFDYLSTKHAHCPNCNLGKDKKNKLILLSEWAFNLPMGIKIAILVTSTYAVYAIIEALSLQALFGLIGAALYDGLLYLWYLRLDAITRPVWFLVLVLVLYLPVLILISLFDFA